MMKIEVKHPIVEDVFKDFYAIPAFQRGYVWQEEQVKALLEDVQDALFDEYGSPIDTEYFVGSVVVYKDEDVYQLIDGQQRLTTLFIILCALRDVRTRMQDTEDLTPLENMIKAGLQDDNGKTTNRFRMTPLYEDAGEMLEKLGAGQRVDLDAAKKLSSSARNMLTAYEVAIDFLGQFANVDKLRLFGARLTKKVRLVRIETSSINEALRIFETINDRGVGLNAVDLLKNLLFMQAKSEAYEKLTKTWKEMVDELESPKVKEKPLRFLRYYILSKFNDARNKSGKPLTEDELYAWLESKKGDERLKIDTNPEGFAKELLAAAKKYKEYVSQSREAGAFIFKLSPRMRQHLVMLLATEGLSDECRDYVSLRLEALLVVFVLIKEPTKALDILFANAAPRLREISQRGVADGTMEVLVLKNFFDEQIKPEIEKRKDRIDAALDQLGYSRTAMSRYLLARIALHVERVANAPHKEFQTYWGCELEHVLSYTPEAALKQKFDKPDLYDYYKQRLGNLLLLEKSINASIGRGAFEEKRKAYEKSNLFMTRSFAKSQSVGLSTDYGDAANLLDSFDDWSSAEIDKRHLGLTKLAKTLWSLE
jgi:hypothetical protein